jgi:hypothetical protein
METQDITEMKRLLSLEKTTKEDWNSTFNLYKKYIDPNIQNYRVGCGCGNSIERLFNILKNWYLSHQT